MHQQILLKAVHNWLYSNNLPTITDLERDYASKLLDSEIKLYQKFLQNHQRG